MRILLPFIVAVGFTYFINAQAPTKFDSVALARTALDHLVKGDYAALVRTFDDKMREALPEEKLRSTWEMVQAQFGSFRRAGEPRPISKGDFSIVIVPGEFERATLDIVFAYTPAGRLGGLNIRPAAPAPTAFVDAPYVTASAYMERDVTVDAGGWPLPGTLALPSGEGPFPAIVLVHGSGPGDRDQALGPNKPFRDLARGLASRKVAVLRYEKRTRQHGAAIAGLPQFTVKEETVDDAVAAVKLLRTVTVIDAKRVFVLGHSLGGMLAPRIAAAAGPDIAGLIIMAGAVRSLEQSILDQTRYLAHADGKVSPDEQKRIGEAQQLVDQVKTLKATDAALSAAGASAPASYWTDLRGFDPPAAARNTKVPMLILQGGRDYQVTPEDFGKWKDALSGRRDVTLKLYPALNHLFISGQGPSLPAEYMTPGHVDEEVVRDIATWVYSSQR